MKILIVEDYEGDIDLLLSRLKTIGCEALVAKSIEEGIAVARTEKPDLILTDLNLGAGIEEGISLIGHLRADPATAAIPLIIHSVFVSKLGDMPEVETQAAGVLPKPFRFVELSTLIARFRESHPTA